MTAFRDLLVCEAVLGFPILAVLLHRANLAEAAARREAIQRHPAGRDLPRPATATRHLRVVR